MKRPRAPCMHLRLSGDTRIHVLLIFLQFEGEDRFRYNVTYMAKVEIDEPFLEPDPFTETDYEAKEACLVRETALESELAKCKATAAASGLRSSPSSCTQCGIMGQNDPGHFSRGLKTDLAAC
ncbi:hypothetical protein FPCIR_14393 [Fusarium pseudocircinatum]|uniref:Uncharacterized protein n=1 Tax=Fusarium pseudocircinatum TaxID=56676 RepID=A0A8H5NPB9_9HYPO|nr:hypothetical protein FPCIR_14393 [Fusarium pseudocircinatum]